nr:reverse transcriptase domain-containing protein [Tanacetum cinerariifolium]
MNDVAIKALMAQGVADALADYEAKRGSGNGHDSHGSRSGKGRTSNTDRVCTYKDFLNCQPLNNKGTEGVVALMCGRMFPNESYQVEKYVGRLLDMIQGSMMASKPKTMQEAIEIDNDLMDQKVGNIEVRGKAYVLGGGETNTNSNVVTGTFLLNNCYTSILFDTGAHRSFVSTALSSLIDIIPTTFDNSYDVELADGRITGVNTIIRGCTLNLLNHTFNINIMPVELGSFEVIIGMDWLSLYHAVIVCDKKTVRVPFGNETLIIHGDGSNHGNKSEEKRLEDVPVIRDFPEVFPEDLSEPQEHEEHLKSILELLKEELEKVIAYTSRQLEIHLKNYTTQDLELGAIVFALKIWRYYLYETKCTVFTDHKSLQHIFDQKGLNMRLPYQVCSLFANEGNQFNGETDETLHEKVVSRHGVSVSIISDRDGRFTSKIWQAFQKALGTQLDMSTTYHPQTDGQSERTIQTLEDMLRARVIDLLNY